MGALFLERLDAAPLSNSEFTFEFNQWIANMIDTLNEVISDLQQAFTFLQLPTYTAVEIAAFFAAGQLSNGILIYDTTNNVYVGMQSGALVKFTTTPYP